MCERTRKIERFRIVVVRRKRFKWDWSVEGPPRYTWQGGQWKVVARGKRSRWFKHRAYRAALERMNARRETIYGRLERVEALYCFERSEELPEPKPDVPEPPPLRPIEQTLLPDVERARQP